MSNLRTHGWDTVTIASSQMTSTVMEIPKVVSGSMLTPSAFTGTEVTFLGAEAPDGTFGKVREASGTTASMTVTVGSWSAIPDVVMTHQSIKLVATSSQAAARTVTITVKD